MTFIRSLFERISNPAGRRKDLTMAKATPPARRADPKASTRRILDAMVSPLKAKIAGLEAGTKKPDDAPAAPAAKPGSALTEDRLLAILDAREAKRSASQSVADQKREFVATKLKDLPAFAAKSLGDDPANWPAEEQALRSDYRASLAAAGVKPANVGGKEPGGKPPAKAVDLTKMSPSEKFELGLKQDEKPPAAAE